MKMNNIFINIQVSDTTGSPVAISAITFDLVREVVGERFRITVSDAPVDQDAPFSYLSTKEALGFLGTFVKQSTVTNAFIWACPMSQRLIKKAGADIDFTFRDSLYIEQELAAIRHFITMLLLV